MSNGEVQAHDESFRLIMARFDAVDRDNKDIKDQLAGHIEDDNAVHKIVNRQSTYWGLLIGIGGPFVLGVVAWFQGLFAK